MRQSPRHRQKLPWPILAIALFAVAFILSPFIGLLWRTPWSKFTDIVVKQEIRDALWLSLKTSLMTAILCVIFGVPLAWLLARVNFPGRRFIRALMTLSMVLPPVVGGIVLNLNRNSPQSGLDRFNSL